MRDAAEKNMCIFLDTAVFVEKSQIYAPSESGIDFFPISVDIRDMVFSG
jgi:hypothetical protein